MKSFTKREKIGYGIIIFGAFVWLLNFKDKVIVAQARDLVIIGILVWTGGYLSRTFLRNKKQ